MTKRTLLLLVCILLLSVSMLGCSSGTEIETELGTFTAKRVKVYDNYGEKAAPAGEKIVVVVLDAPTDFDESQYKSYFCGEDSKAEIKVGNNTYACDSVAVQGEKGSSQVEYGIVFLVPESDASTNVSFKAPGQSFVGIK